MCFRESREESPRLTSRGPKAAVCLPVCRERKGALGKRSGRAVWKKMKTRGTVKTLQGKKKRAPRKNNSHPRENQTVSHGHTHTLSVAH